MKLTLDLENLEEIVKKSMEDNMEEAVKKVVESVVNENIKEQTDEAVNEAIRSYVDDYLKETKVTVGNSWDDDGVKEYTLEQYLKLKIDKIFEEQVFRTKTKDRWGDWKETKVTFKEYIDSAINIESVIGDRIKQMANGVKMDVAAQVKATFDESMRKALADNVFQVLSSSDTYRTITNSIRQLSE